LDTWKNHPNYSGRTLQNDISVMKFSHPFDMNQYVQTIKMPEARTGEWLPDGETVRTCGWGDLTPNGGK